MCCKLHRGKNYLDNKTILPLEQRHKFEAGKWKASKHVRVMALQQTSSIWAAEVRNLTGFKTWRKIYERYYMGW